MHRLQIDLNVEVVPPDFFGACDLVIGADSVEILSSGRNHPTSNVSIFWQFQEKIPENFCAMPAKWLRKIPLYLPMEANSLHSSEGKKQKKSSGRSGRMTNVETTIL